ncbi:hypothetical protein V6N13_009905 [Hibiscus sabdariffa]
MMRETSKRLREWMAVMDLRMSGASEESDVLEKRKVMARISQDPVSVILEQVRAIKAGKSSPHFVKSKESLDEIESLARRLDIILDRMKVLSEWSLPVQLSRIEIDGFSFDEVLYDLEDLFGRSNTQPMQSNIQTDAAKTLKVCKEETKRLGVSMSRNPKSPIEIPESMTRLSNYSFNRFSMYLDTSRFESSISMLEIVLKRLERRWNRGLFDWSWAWECLNIDRFLVKVPKLYGIEQVKKDVMNVILGKSSKEGSDNIKTISIFGEKGMGKTSLAQCICKDEQVVASFGKIVLVDVSGDFDLHKIARDIIQSLEGLNHDFLHILTLVPLQSLLDRIYRKIVKEKVLLVLDGVERYDCDDWLALRAVFQHGKSESRILITTREHKFAVAMESCNIFHLKELPDELCWMILRGVAFHELIRYHREDVEDIGLEIARKCKGSPFAAKVLGCVLWHKREEREWHSVLENHIWESHMIPKYIFKILWLSYWHLPWSMRQCLLYCSIFPKNFEMSVTLLVQHWMAQGYLNSFDGSDDMELNGKDYFEIFVGHSFIQDFSKNGGIRTWKMHSIVHDFVQFLFRSKLVMEIKSVENMRLDLASARRSKEFKADKPSTPSPSPEQMNTFSDSGTSILASSSDPQLVPDSSCPPVPSKFSLTSIRHLIIMIAQGAGFPVDISGAEKLRTLVAVSEGCFITSGALSNLFKQSKHLRLLDLSLSSGWHNCFGPCGKGNILDKVPEEISELINLRFLSLAGSKELKILPETLCDLYNLQSLDLTRCSSLTELPEGMGKLKNLMYLYTWYCSSITFYPKGIGRLTSLRELSNIIVRVDDNDGKKDGKEFSLRDLADLRDLRGVVCVKLVGDVINAGDAINAGLWNKKNLENIRINLEGDIKEDDVIKALKPPPELKIEFIDWWF